MTYQEFITKHKIGFSAELLGKRTDDSGWAHYAWECVLQRGEHEYRFPYRCGLGHVTHKPTPRRSSKDPGFTETPTPPSPPDVLENLVSDARMGELPWDDYCSDLGASESLESLDQYRACIRTKQALRRLLGPLYADLQTLGAE